MLEKRNKRFAFYTVSLYRIGNYTDAALIGAMMFEKAIYFLLKNKNISKQYVADNRGNQGDLQYAISLICKKYSKFDAEKLNSIRLLRNDITHGLYLDEIEREKLIFMILFTWETLDELSYKKYSGDINKIDFLTADYHVVDIREMLNENLQDILAKDRQFKAFELEDFQELYKLRRKIISLGSRIKKEVLKINHKNELFIDIISKIDTTSAYVWMSMNLYNEDRKRIDSASASILGTPLDLRVYFDIGGGGYQVRQDYYKFLKSDYFFNFIENIDLNDMELFDNDWYCFIVDRAHLSKLSIEEIKDRAKKAEDKLKEYDENSKLSWNKMLCGYIFKRGEVSFEEIKKKLEIVIKLYYCFEYFRQRELQRKEISFKYDIANMCKKRTKPPTYLAKNIKLKEKK